jgi:hypothetical protein
MHRDSLAHGRSGLLAAWALLGCSAGVLRADEVYRSVDAGGHVVYSDQSDVSAAPRSAVPLEAAPGPPALIHVCWTNCFTLQWEHGLYTRVDGSDETWSIERFTPESFVLHRHDAPAAWNGYSADVIYAGQVSSSQLINVTVNGRAVPDIAAAWGPALATLPGSNAERDQRNAGPAPAPAPTPEPELHAMVAPPPLPDYEQPPCPADGYLWTPGYWSWGAAGYYWVPGLWVLPPRVGVLWTPGYWGFVGTGYVFHPGYWGPHVGYYGGVHYGFGYVGVGFAGGRWVGSTFAYNAAVANVNLSLVHSTYRETVAANLSVNRVSYNGGPGGTAAVPTAEERAVAAEAHIPSTPVQRQSVQQAFRSPATMVHVNGTALGTSATQRAAVFHAPPASVTHRTAAPPATGQQVVAHSAPQTSPAPRTRAVPPAKTALTAATPAKSVHPKH